MTQKEARGLQASLSQQAFLAPTDAFRLEQPVLVDTAQRSQ